MIEQLALTDGALAFDVRRPRLEPRDVLLVQLKLGGVLDGDDALALGDEPGQHVQERRLTGAGAAAMSAFSRARTDTSRNSSIGRVSDRIATRSSARRRSAGKRRIESSGPSTASGGMIALTREPSGEARVDHRRAVVDATADAADDAVDDAHQVLVVLERRRQPVELAAALDVDVLVGVDQDVADRRIAQQRFERPEPEDLVDDIAKNRVALAHAERHALFGNQVEEQRANVRFRA